jgi:hypothetical protein
MELILLSLVFETESRCFYMFYVSHGNFLRVLLECIGTLMYIHQTFVYCVLL